MEGWVKLHRSIFEWEWYDDLEAFRLFTHCLLKANHKDANWRGQEIKTGSFITSYSKLAEETGLTIKVVRNRLKKLEKSGELGTLTSNKNTLVTVLKYGFFQGEKEQEGKQRARKGHAEGKQRATNKNDNNKKNENKSIEVDPILKVLSDAESSDYPIDVKHRYKVFIGKIKEHCPTISKIPKQLNIKTYYELVSRHGEEKIGMKIEALDLWLEEKGQKKKDFNLFLKRCMLKEN